MISDELDKFENLGTEERISKVRSVLAKRQSDLTVVLENINDPHNISAALRSCDATGVNEVELIYHGLQKMPKLGKKSSASAKKWVDVSTNDSVDNCFKKLRSKNRKIYTTNLSEEARSIYEIDLTENIAIVFGNEHDGVSKKATDQADGNIFIPQVGMIQSLNISVAVAVTMYEVFRQRMKAGMYDNPSFEVSLLDELTKNWLER